MQLIRRIKYMWHRILYIKKDSQQEKDFRRAVEEKKAKEMGKDWWRV